MFTRFASLALLCVIALHPARAADPFLKPNDVIALVGGEDMVAASEYGYLELLLQRALPQNHLKVRSLAWEGDTVFEQPRDLNYPTLEQQLDDLGATVVIMQFGQMESLAGTSKLPEFLKAYEKLIERVSAGGKRRVVIAPPPSNAAEASESYASAAADLASRLNLPACPVTVSKEFAPPPEASHLEKMRRTRDGIHVAPHMLLIEAMNAARSLGSRKDVLGDQISQMIFTKSGEIPDAEIEKLRQLIADKNRLWFHYTRPQNWAFLNGDRTEQPSSRDWKDPSKRWFPEEMKEWLPLIDAKEKEIWELAAKASAK